MSNPFEPFPSAKHRYQTDPLFHQLVDTMRSLLRGSQATPSELREALMLAAYCEEMENPSPAVHRVASLSKILAADVTEERQRAEARHDAATASRTEPAPEVMRRPRDSDPYFTACFAPRLPAPKVPTL